MTRIKFFEVSDQFWFGRNLLLDNPDRVSWEESWEDNWHVWCGCPL